MIPSLLPSLPQPEQPQHDGPCSDDEDGEGETEDGHGGVAGTQPTPVAALQDTQHHQSQADGGQHGPDLVEMRSGAAVGLFLDPAHAQENGRHQHDLGGEDETPGEVGGDPATDQRSDCDAGPGQAADDPVGDGPVPALVGPGHESGERRKDQRRAESFDHRPADGEHPQDRGHSGEGGARGVHDQPDAEHLAASEHVSEFPTRDHEGCHDEGVEGDDGLNRGDLGVEVLDQLTDRDVHDRGVEHHQELGRTEDDQSPPSPHRLHLQSFRCASRLVRATSQITIKQMYTRFRYICC